VGVSWYPKSDAEWYPRKPTATQVAFGVVFLLTLAGVPLLMLRGETDAGNRVFLLVLAGFPFLLAVWRIAVGVRLFREARSRRRIRAVR
jgi:hypothetical protein